MASGDTIGGAAALQQHEFDTNFTKQQGYFNSMLAARAQNESERRAAVAEQLAREQAAEQDALRQQDYLSRQQDVQDRNNQFNLSYLTQRDDAAAAARDRAASLGLQTDYFNLTKDKQAQDLQRHLDEVGNQGTALAGNYGQAHDDFQQTKAALDAIDAEKLRLANIGQKLGYSFNQGKGLLYLDPHRPPDASLLDPSGGKAVARINEQLVALNDQLQQARQTYAEKKYVLNHVENTARNSGFTPDHATQTLVHGRTGHRFSFGQPSEMEDYYNALPDTVTSTAPAPISHGASGYWGDAAPPVSASDLPSESSSGLPSYLQGATGSRRVKVADTNGNLFTVPVEQLAEAVQSGYAPIQ